MLLSIVVPAFNEERYLPATLICIQQAILACPCRTELIVVDNASTDRIADVATSLGAIVVSESIHNIARVRNAGAAAAKGEGLVFIDADTMAPPHFLARVVEELNRPDCFGGAADILHKPSSRPLVAYLAVWRWIGIRMGMAQGAAQFVRRTPFLDIGGFDEAQFMGEDVDFFWKLSAKANKDGGFITRLHDVTVLPSPRLFDRTPIWRTLLWTNPLFIVVFRKTAKAWKDWYVTVPR